jgi:ABC-type nitrate/sulfonate/bicarbonate transport system substrate-binding protein
LHDQVNAHHACLRRGKPSAGDRLYGIAGRISTSQIRDRPRGDERQGGAFMGRRRPRVFRQAGCFRECNFHPSGSGPRRSSNGGRRARRIHGGTTVLTAVAGGADLKIIGSLTNRLGYDMVAAPNIKTPKDLRGKRFGVQTLAGTVWLGAMLGLEHLGLEAKRDNITFLVIGDQTVATQALEGGQIDVTVLDGVFSRRLKQKGFTILAELQKANIPFSSQGLVARGAFLQEQRETMEGVMKGLLESIAFCLAPKNKSAVLATITKRLKLADASVAEDGYQDVINGVERKPYPVIEGLRNIQRLMKIRNPALDKVKVEDMIDDRILRRLDESGFIDNLAKTYPAK